MNIENPVALHFILQDEIYLLNKDKSLYATANLPVEELKDSEVPTAIITETPVDFAYMGKNKTGFLILTHYPNTEHIAEAHLTALENILKRKDLAVDDVAILNLATYGDTHFEAITTYFNPNKILLLGSNALPTGIAPLELNIPQQIENTLALYSFSFDEMMDSNDNKKAFWEQMKLL